MNYQKETKGLTDPYNQYNLNRVIQEIDFGPDANSENIYDRCWTMNKDASFLLNPYPNTTAVKPMIRCYPLDKNKKRKMTSQGLQNFALVMFSRKDGSQKTYKEVAHQEWTTTCGNPYCMNPEHIVKGTGRSNRRDNKIIEIKNALDNPKFDSLAEFLNVMDYATIQKDENKIAKRYNMSLDSVKHYKHVMVEAFLGEGYTWEEFMHAVDVAEGIRHAEQRRTPGYAAYILEHELRKSVNQRLAPQSKDLFD